MENLDLFSENQKIKRKSISWCESASNSALKTQLFKKFSEKLVINHFSENNPQALKIFTNTHRSSYKYEFILDPRIIELVELAIIKIDEIEKKES